MTWIDQALVLRMGWTLVHFLWQGALLAGVLALILWSTRGQSPRLRYGMACAVLLVMAVAPVATWYRLGQPQAASRVVLRSSDRVAPASRSVTPTESASPVVDAAAPGRAWDGILPLSVDLWLFGVAIMSLRLASGWAWLQWLRRRPDTVPAPDDIQLRLLRLCQRMNLVSNIRILLCEKVPGPTVMGWLRPVILLPPAALLGMPADQLELVLAHELAHILRHDFAINLIQSCVEVLLFYHPAVWWVSAKIRQERELCCDDLAVRTTGDALDYAAALTRLETLCRPPDPPRHATQALALSATGGSFMHRIRRLISPIAPTPLAPRAGLVMLLLLGAVFTLQARTGPRIQAPLTLAEQLPKGAIHLCRYDKDTADGKRKAGTIDLKANFVTATELIGALTSLEQQQKDLSKGYVDLEVKVNPVPEGSHYAYEFKGCDPVRVRRIIQARDAFPYLEQGDKKPGHIVIQRLARFTYELGVLPQGLHVQIWAGDVPVETVLEALNELMAMAPEAGIPQEIRRHIPPDSGKGKRISLDVVDKDPLQLWKELDPAVKNEQH
jgi:beta-lactamase regulating signal transducer with metallopeptidase domain